MRVQALLPDRRLPLEVQPKGDARAEALIEWLGAEQAQVLRMLREAGALLFRGFLLADAVDFQRVISAFDAQPRRYVGGQSPRTVISERVYTSTEYPAGEQIPLHHELSYTASPPAFLAFFCERPPLSGGETPLLDGRRYLEALPSHLRAAFEGRGLRYLKNMHGGGGLGLGLSWQEHFETDDVDQVEAWLRQEGALWSWTPDGGLSVEFRRPATCRHPVTGEVVWYNQATLWHISRLGSRAETLRQVLGEEALPTHVSFDDGSPISDAWMQELRALEWSQASHFPWRRGDLLLVDNGLVAHGRAPFQGERRVLVSMGDGPL